MTKFLVSRAVFALILVALMQVNSVSALAEKAAENTAINETDYVSLSNKVWSLYNEDLAYSSNVLNEFTKKNISNKEALGSTLEVFLLNSQTTGLINQIEPPEKYSTYHNNTVSAMAAFQNYLLNLAKFYETGNIGYAQAAKDLFNESLEYHDKAIEASIFMKA
jgi:hypothetical protein